MEATHKDLLRRNYSFLAENLNAEIVVDALIEEDLISRIAADRIRHKSFKWDRNRTFLDYLPRTGPRTFPVFLKTLKCYQPDVYTKLTGETVALPRMNDKISLIESKLDVNVIVILSRRNWATGVKVVEEIERHCNNSSVLIISVEDLHNTTYFNSVLDLMNNKTIVMPIICVNLACDFRNQVKLCSLMLKSNKNYVESRLRPVYLDNVQVLEMFEQLGELRWGKDKEIIFSIVNNSL